MRTTNLKTKHQKALDIIEMIEKCDYRILMLISDMQNENCLILWGKQYFIDRIKRFEAVKEYLTVKYDKLVLGEHWYNLQSKQNNINEVNHSMD